MLEVLFGSSTIVFAILYLFERSLVDKARDNNFHLRQRLGEGTPQQIARLRAYVLGKLGPKGLELVERTPLP